MPAEREADITRRDGIMRVAASGTFSRREFEKRPTDTVVVLNAVMRSPLGNTEESIEALLNGVNAVKSLDSNLTDVDAPQVAATLGNYDPRDDLDLGPQKKYFSRLAGIQLAVYREALGGIGMLNSEGRIKDPAHSKRGAFIVYSGKGPSMFYWDLGMQGVAIEQIRAMRREDPTVVIPKELRLAAATKPSDAIQAFADMPNALAAIQMGMTDGDIRNGANACSSAAFAIKDLFDKIRLGEVSWGLAGGAEMIFDTPEHAAKAAKIFDGVKALTHNPDPETASRPFDKNRDGFVMGEGVGVLVLASREFANEIGVTPMAVLKNATTSVDADDVFAANVGSLHRIFERTLMNEDGTIDLPDRDLAHGTSTWVGDPREMSGLRLTYPGEQLYRMKVKASKSLIGHAIGASGALSAVEAVHSFKRGLGPTIHLLEPDPEVVDRINVLTERSDERPNEVMVNAFGFGGQNSVLLFRRWVE